MIVCFRKNSSAWRPIRNNRKMEPSKPRIAIPVPTSTNADYNRRSWPHYANAVTAAGGEPVEIPLTLPPPEVARLIAGCQAVLLPGASPDLNPQKYGAVRQPECGADDPAREAMDELLLEDAHTLRKPLLGICYGMQGLNVWRGGTLVQHLAPMPVNHKAARGVTVAHSIVLAPGSLLAGIVRDSGEEIVTADGINSGPRIGVNSSHHQAIAIPGDGLRVSARSTEDGVIESVESGADGHFVLGVQWHPERSTDLSAASRAIFARFVAEARAWKPRPMTESVAD
jgi:putative glutamine amidotransferase